jgi:phage shock protein E
MIRRQVVSLVLASVLALPILASARQNVDQAAAVPRISQKEFKKLSQAGEITVIDVRDAGSYAAGHIPGALLMPEETLEKHVAELKASKKPIVAYCS